MPGRRGWKSPGSTSATGRVASVNLDGSTQMPYYEFSAEARELISRLPVTPFDWPSWMKTDEAQRLVRDHGAIATASADQLVKLTTAVVRSDRFTEGSVAGAFESGLLAAIARRAATLADLTPDNQK